MYLKPLKVKSVGLYFLSVCMPANESHLDSNSLSVFLSALCLFVCLSICLSVCPLCSLFLDQSLETISSTVPLKRVLMWLLSVSASNFPINPQIWHKKKRRKETYTVCGRLFDTVTEQ